MSLNQPSTDFLVQVTSSEAKTDHRPRAMTHFNRQTVCHQQKFEKHYFDVINYKQLNGGDKYVQMRYNIIHEIWIYSTCKAKISLNRNTFFHRQKKNIHFFKLTCRPSLAHRRFFQYHYLWLGDSKSLRGKNLIELYHY